MQVEILGQSRYEMESMLYATVYQQMTKDEQDIMNSFLFASIDLYVGTLDGEIACVWGLVPPTLCSSKAYMWLYTTDVVKEHQFLFIRHSQIALEKAFEKYDSIVGTMIAGNEKTARWLRWLGATFSPVEGMKVPFEIRKR